MAYYGRLLSNELLLHAIRSARPALTDAQGKPLNMVTLRRRADGRLAKSGEYLRHKRRELFKQQRGRCYYCREPMVLIERGAGGARIRHRPDEATLEHLDPRYSDERGKHPGTMRVVAACSRCNTERSNRDILAMPIQTRWEMSRLNFVDICKRSGALNEVEL